MISKRSMEEIREEYEQYGKTLAVFRPQKVHDIQVKREPAEWTDGELAKLQQTSFLETKALAQLKKVPYSFHIRYQCDDPRCLGHSQSLIEWEIGQTYWRYLQYYSTETEALDRLKQKYMERLDSKDYDRFLFVGTLSNHPKTFIIIGQYSYMPKN